VSTDGVDGRLLVAIK